MTSQKDSPAVSPIAENLALAPFLPGGLGDLMCKAASAYTDEYVLSLEDGPDHEPTEFERAMLEDFFAGLVSDEKFFGPIRRVLLQAAAGRVLMIAMGEIERLFTFEYPVPLQAQAVAKEAIEKVNALGSDR